MKDLFEENELSDCEASNSVALLLSTGIEDNEIAPRVLCNQTSGLESFRLFIHRLTAEVRRRRLACGFPSSHIEGLGEAALNAVDALLQTLSLKKHSGVYFLMRLCFSAAQYLSC